MSLFCPECKTTYDDEGLRICPHDGTALYTMSTEPDLAGQVIDGRFRIDKIIGHGGMGTVYEAQQLSVGRQVAVKVLRRELSDREVALERFFREAKMISGLTHPNIVRLIDFGQDRERDLLYLVMEYVRGTNLADLIANGRMRMAFALEILYQVCGALTEPHAIGVIHRDLKPDNLLLVPISDGDIQAKVLDFGISRAVESKTQLTGSGMICGTPAYMAPEQAQNEDLDARADIYALGVILYEMVSGWPPFAGTSSLQIMLKHIAEEPRPLRDLLPPATLPKEVEELVADLMAKDPNARPKSVRAIRKRIDALRKSYGLETPVVSDQTDLLFKEFMLPKLPEGRGFGSSPTEALRRETGLELWATKADTQTPPPPGLPADSKEYDTEAEAGLGETLPLTPEGRESVLHDVPSGDTKGGAQQAWTPSAQHAVQGIKDTNKADGVDSDPTFSVPNERIATSSGVEPAMQGRPNKSSNASLIVTVIVLIALLGGAFWFTLGFIQDRIEAQAAATPAIEVPVEKVVEKKIVDIKQLEFVRAVTLAQVRTHGALSKGERAASESKKIARNGTTKKTNKKHDPPKIEAKEKVEVKKTTKSDKKSDEAYFRDIIGRDETE